MKVVRYPFKQGTSRNAGRYVGTRLTLEEKRKLLKLAVKKDRSVSNVIHNLIRTLLKEAEEEGII